MIKIKWHLTAPVPEIRTSQMKPANHWKAGVLRGYDLAEFVVEELWKTEGVTVKQIHIVEPKEFAGDYEIITEMSPSFTAKKLGVEPPKSKPSKSKAISTEQW